MTNTQLRIISAIVMMALFVTLNILGQTPLLVFIFVIGIIVNDEIMVNFIKSRRFSSGYNGTQLIFIISYLFFQFIDVNFSYFQTIVNAGLVINVLMIMYLFYEKNESKTIKRILDVYPFAIGILSAVLINNIALIIQFPKWSVLLWGLILLNFSVDIAAWFFGKNFGKHKLWEAVSPKKTIEGAIGGVITSSILFSIYWTIFIGELSFSLGINFILLTCCAQIGDLVQSKLKRQYNIKDSSNLIPGHGGVYDRIDSLLFVTPLYLYTVINFYQL
jgi:phosphatidate cytidylyltransferase